MNNPKKTLLEVVDELSDLLKDNHNFYEIIFKGKKTSLRITKPKEEDKDEKLQS